MRAEVMKYIAPHMTARGAVLMILASDLEACNNIIGATMSHGRSFNSLKEYNPKITRATMSRLIAEGLVEQVGFAFRLKGRLKKVSL